MENDEVTKWMESFGWKPLNNLFGELAGYTYGDECYMDYAMAETYWFIREACPYGPATTVYE